MSTPRSRHDELQDHVLAEALADFRAGGHTEVTAGLPRVPEVRVSASPELPPLFVRNESPAVAPADPPAAPADPADRCLRCRRQAPGAYYAFGVARARGLSHRILHEESAFICDHCARAELRFAPLVVLLLWVPVFWLCGGLLCQVAALYTHLTTLWLSLPVLFILVGLVRSAWRQLRAVRLGLYHRPPYSSTVAHLAIRLRKKELLRSLHVLETEVRFFAAAERGDLAGQDGTVPGVRAERG
jgi:hypothetical protein